MNVRISVSEDLTPKITIGSQRVRIEDVNKFLTRNRDAILVKMDGRHDPSMKYKPGHICRIEEDTPYYNVFVGSHYIGHLPEEAITFAETVDSSPEYLVAMVGKVENDEIYIYIAE